MEVVKDILSKFSENGLIVLALFVVGAFFLLLAVCGRIRLGDREIGIDAIVGRWILGTIGAVFVIPSLVLAIWPKPPASDHGQIADASICPASSELQGDWIYLKPLIQRGSTQALTDWLNNKGLDPCNVYIFTSWPDIHVWYRGSKKNARYEFVAVPYTISETDQSGPEPFLEHSKTQLPIGWVSGAFGYYRVRTE